MHPLIVVSSQHSVGETVARLKSELSSKNITLFALIDHAKEAHNASLDLQEEVLLIFGNPKAGTFLMQENPAIGIELPLKILVFKTEKGTQVCYKDPLALAEAYGIQKHRDVVEKINTGLAELIKKITS